MQKLHVQISIRREQRTTPTEHQLWTDSLIERDSYGRGVEWFIFKVTQLLYSLYLR